MNKRRGIKKNSIWIGDDFEYYREEYDGYKYDGSIFCLSNLGESIRLNVTWTPESGITLKNKFKSIRAYNLSNNISVNKHRIRFSRFKSLR